MDVSHILQEAKSRVGEHGDLLGVEVLLAFVLGKGREFLLAHPESELTDGQQERFSDFFRRFSQGEPVAYLTGNKEFFGLNFFVDRRVLIPRPETELLVEKVLELVKGGRLPETAKILEIGTGSGCISVALAKNNPEFRITATDISTDALEVAKLNANRHGVAEKICFLESDLLKNVEVRSTEGDDGNLMGEPFELIVANLPYIGRSRFHFVSREAYDYEPHVALFGGEDGLGLYEKLFREVREKSWDPAFILGEFGFLQREELERIVRENFSPDTNALEFLPDYAKIDRVFIVTRKRT